MAEKKTFEPQVSIKLNTYHSLLIVNCNLPKCPERFIQLKQDDEQVVIETPGFSKHYLATLKVPSNCRVLSDTMRKTFNGNLLTVTWKVEFREAYDTEQPVAAKEEYKPPRVMVPPVVKPKVVESKKHGKFYDKNDKVALLSNYVTQKCQTESEVLEKIADKAIKKVGYKLHEKEEVMNKQLEMFEMQQKAREARKAAKKGKKVKPETLEKKGK